MTEYMPMNAQVDELRDHILATLQTDECMELVHNIVCTSMKRDPRAEVSDEDEAFYANCTCVITKALSRAIDHMYMPMEEIPGHD